MSVKKKAELALNTARVGLILGRERIVGRGPLTATDVPGSVDALTTDWLTSALCAGTPDAEVVSFRLGGGTDGSTHRGRLTVSYSAAGEAAGLPTALFTKSTPSLITRVIGLTGTSRGEHGFYTAIRPQLDIECPQVHYSGYEPRASRAMFILEDVATTKSARFGEPQPFYVDRALAEQLVTTMARYHGQFWEHPWLSSAQAGWLGTPRDFHAAADAVLGFEKGVQTGIDKSEGRVPAELVRRRKEIWPLGMRSLEMNTRPPRTLVHTDTHSRNWYATGDGRMGLLDWQIVSKGQWPLDVAYALTSNLTIEDRRAWERDLLELYLDRLGESGGQPPSPDEAWLMYRQQVMHPLIFWLYTISPRNPKQPVDVCWINIERMAQAAVDLETLDSLGGR